MIIAQVSIAPVGKGVDLSAYVKRAIKVLQNETEKCETNAMSTIIETKTTDQLFNAVKNAHNEVINMLGVQRVITEIKIDDRKDKNASIESKLKATMD